MMRNVGLVAVTLAALVAVVLGCSPDEMCQNEDCGSCANSCCRLNFFYKNTDTETIMGAINATWSDGGPDGQYSLPETAQNTFGFTDLRVYDTDVDFIGQSFHVTDSGTYTDTIDVTVAPMADGVHVRAFSVSQIGGAYCDAGQNWYNVMAIFQAMPVMYDSVKGDGSCPAPTDS